jgi:IrrE N-terminal-like domain
MHQYHPWRHLRDQHPDVHVDPQCALPPGTVGRWTADGRLELSDRSSQQQRRSTLAHEIVHLERGPVPRDPRQRGREERIVEETAARRLIPLELLIDAIRWGQGTADHDELWVDPSMLLIRFSTLAAAERATIPHALRD